ncbi:hypothetical protein GCM10009760_14830 [Kitasatospora kazusensis]|uniref:Papain fold toxin 1 (Glutamine deamidase) of polymorphic toxin system n=1 Tax=Kitasatospora kazusensis TaxID=407974 RepID=A0ABN2Z2P6_9ACTN
MAVELPEPLQWVLLLLAGTRWPEADEGQLRDMADHWRKVGASLQDASHAADAAVKQALEGQQGTAADALTKHWAEYTVGKGTEADPGYLPGLINSCNGMGDMLEGMANSAETAKIQIIAQLGILAFELATAEAEAVVTAGASLAEAPVFIATTREIVQQALKKLLKEALQHALKQAVQMAAINLLAQTIELAQGHRKSIDMKEVGQNALGGAVAGATGHLLGKGIGAAGAKMGLGGAMGTTAGKMVTGAAVGVGTDAITQLVTTGHVDSGSLLGSGLSGGAGAGLHAGASAAKAHFNEPTMPEGGFPGGEGGAKPTFSEGGAGTGNDSYQGPGGSSGESGGSGSHDSTGGESSAAEGGGDSGQSSPSSGTNGLVPFGSQRPGGSGGGSGHDSPAPSSSHGSADSGPAPSPSEGPAGGHDSAGSQGSGGHNEGLQTSPAHAETTPRESSPRTEQTPSEQPTNDTPPAHAETTPRESSPRTEQTPSEQPGGEAAPSYGEATSGSSADAGASGSGVAPGMGAMAGAHLPGAVPGTGGTHLDGTRLASGPAPTRTPSANHAPGSPDDLSSAQAPGTDTPPAAAPPAGGAVPPMMPGAGGGFAPGPVHSGGRPGAEPHQSPPPAPAPAPAGKPTRGSSFASAPGTGGAKLGPVRPRGERPGTDTTKGGARPVDTGHGTHSTPNRSEHGTGHDDAPPPHTSTGEHIPAEKPAHDNAPAPEHRNEPENGDKGGIAAPHDHDPATTHDQDTPHTGPDDNPHHEDDAASGPHHDQDTSPHHDPDPEPRPEAEPHRPATDDRPLGTEGGLTEPTPEDHERIRRAVPLNEDGTPQRYPDPTEGTWLAAINGDGPGTSGRNNNCVDATLALLDTFHGHPTAAAARTPDHDANGNPSDLGELGGRDRMENNLGAKFSDLGDGPAGFDRLEDTLRRNGHGSSAVITTRDADGRTHSWGAFNRNGKITYADGQTGKSSDKPLHNGDNGVFAIPLTPDRTPLSFSPEDGPLGERRAPARPAAAPGQPMPGLTQPAPGPVPLGPDLTPEAQNRVSAATITALEGLPHFTVARARILALLNIPHINDAHLRDLVDLFPGMNAAEAGTFYSAFRGGDPQMTQFANVMGADGAKMVGRLHSAGWTPQQIGDVMGRHSAAAGARPLMTALSWAAHGNRPFADVSSALNEPGINWQQFSTGISKFAQRPAPQAGASGMGGRVIHTTNISGASGPAKSVVREERIEHFKQGHTLEDFKFDTPNIMRNSRSTFWLPGTDVRVLANTYLKDPATRQLAENVSASGQSRSAVINNHTVGMAPDLNARNPGDVQMDQLYPNGGYAIDQATLKAIGRFLGYPV